MQRAVLGKWYAATVGNLLFAFFFVLGALGVAMLTYGGLSGKLPRGPAQLGLYAVVVLTTAGLGYLLRRELRLFRVVDIADDNTWTVRNALGFVLGRVEPTVPRAVRTKEQEVTMWAITPTRYTASWIEIEAGGRTWKSVRSLPKVQRAAIDLLRGR
jgi:hypothetical protein